MNIKRYKKIMLENILSISGKSGLFKLVSRGKNVLIVESLIDKKRVPVHSHEKVVSLSDISMFTTEDDVLLSNVLENIKNKNNGEKLDLDTLDTNEKLYNALSDVLPNFDKDKVYITDVKKLFRWYNILMDNGITSFLDDNKGE